jgi:hypothetical protein
VLQAVTVGLGFALGDLLLVREVLKSNHLVAPFEYMEVTTGEYFLSWPENNTDKPGVIPYIRLNIRLR